MTCWVTVGDTLGNEEALVDMLADTVPNMEEKSAIETRGGAQALGDTLADTVLETKELSVGDSLTNAQ